MNTVASLEGLGLTLSITPDGKLALEGLKRLSTAQRDHALAVAREHKPAILDELRRRAGLNPWEAHWHATCPDYWRGCLSCPDASLVHAVGPMAGALNSRFCKRHDPPPWACEATHGGVLQ